MYTARVSDPDTQILSLLRLLMVPGLGPIRLGRLLDRFSNADEVLRASPKALEGVQGIGPTLAARFAAGFKDPGPAERELARSRELGIHLIAKGSAGYPPLLAQLRDAPPLLYAKGEPSCLSEEYACAIVGSRECSAYGLEQASRFAESLARAGVAIVSGGARGIDTSAHAGALRAGGRTVAVLGCGLDVCYPPENEALFRAIAERGCVVSELPLSTQPDADNFPARNRVISGLSLGVIVVEAGRRSGALITAKLAAEEHGREVMAVPGRVDDPGCQGSLDLIKAGGAMMVTEPGDVLALLEGPARHQFAGTHAARFATRPDPGDASEQPPACEADPIRQAGATRARGGDVNSVEAALPPDSPRARILAALDRPRTLDELQGSVGIASAELQATLTLLEIERRVRRVGGRVERTNASPKPPGR